MDWQKNLIKKTMLQVPEVERKRFQRLSSVKNDVAVTSDITKDDEQVGENSFFIKPAKSVTGKYNYMSWWAGW